MIRFTIFPRLLVLPGQKANPYIQDFAASLSRSGESEVVNPPHKNPLFSLLLPRRWGDVFVFNWFENIPDYKYGTMQAVVGVCFVVFLKICGKKIVWVLHNRESHLIGYAGMKKFLTRFIARWSDLILTHAEEGMALAESYCPKAAGKVHFLHHPTKNRLPESRPTEAPVYDLLIWGKISRYKGVLEYLTYLRDNPQDRVKVCVVGECSSPSLAEEVTRVAPGNVTFVNKGLSFEELRQYVSRSAFVLAPYRPESILSSGTLMDSLSFGARVIGPDVGSFKDYSREVRLNVYTFRDYGDIGNIVEKYRDCPVSLEGYRDFLEENSWPHFGKRVVELVKNLH